MMDVVPNHMGNQATCVADNCPDNSNFTEFTPFNDVNTDIAIDPTHSHGR